MFNMSNIISHEKLTEIVKIPEKLAVKIICAIKLPLIWCHYLRFKLYLVCGVYFIISNIESNKHYYLYYL